MLIAEAPESRSLEGDKTSFMIHCESIKERGIRRKTEKILKKNFEKKTTLKKKLTLKKQMSRCGLETTALSRPAGN